MNFAKEFTVHRHRFNAGVIDLLYEYHFAKKYWPVVYLLKEVHKTKPSAYVGETFDIIRRLTTHLNHPDKSKLQEALLISGNKFNKSVTLDIEANCIRYLSGDGIYKLLNANLGLADHSYYQKEELYDEVFRSIWEELRAMGVVRQTLKQIDNSDLFKYSPYKTLSPDQTRSLILILESLLNDRYNSIVIGGGAGSGKTVLAVFLFKLLHTPLEDFNFRAFGPEDKLVVDLVLKLKGRLPNLKMALVIAMNSFRSTVQKIFRNVEGLSAAMVIGPSDLRRNRYDIVLVDEAHRLRRRMNLGNYFRGFDSTSEALGFDREINHELDWVLKQSDKNILFYDEFQSVRPSDVSPEAFDSLKNYTTTKTEYLYSQFRVRGGLKYVNFITHLLKADLPGNTEKFKNKKYEFLVFHDLQQMIDHIKEKEREEQLARMMAGFAWPWESNLKKKGKKKDFDIEIGTLKLKWNSVPNNWIHSPNAINEIGCIHTVQGYDLNYAGIIFGNEIGYDREKGEIIIRKENYYDRNGKNGIKNPEQLKGFITNIYKTMMLRGIKGTYIYVCDEALREYFSRYIPLFKETGAAEEIKQSELEPYVNCVPMYNLSAAAGNFSEQQKVSAETVWYPVKSGIRISKDHFACKVVGESMNKEIPNGAVCLFRKYSGGTRNGEIVLVALADRQDIDFGSCYTVKKYSSIKKHEANGEWEHEQIMLEPASTDPYYEKILLEGNELTRLEVIGIFETVL